MLIPTTLSVYLSIYPLAHVLVFIHSFSVLIPTRRSIYLFGIGHMRAFGVSAWRLGRDARDDARKVQELESQ